MRCGTRRMLLSGIIVWHIDARASVGYPGCRTQVDRLQYAEHSPCPYVGLTRCTVDLYEGSGRALKLRICLWDAESV
jgi:hypothetical protein